MKTITYNHETHVLVPIEPSEEMLQAATADSCWEDMNPPPSVAYRSMLAAAPQPEPLGEPFSTILRENLDSLYEADGKPHKPVESEQVYQVCMADSVSLSGAWIDVDKQTYHDAGLYKEYKLRSLYTTPQPDRTAELEQLRQQLADSRHERDICHAECIKLTNEYNSQLAAKDEVIAEAGEMLAMRDRQLAALKAENEVLHD